MYMYKILVGIWLSVGTIRFNFPNSGLPGKIKFNTNQIIRVLIIELVAR